MSYTKLPLATERQFQKIISNFFSYLKSSIQFYHLEVENCEAEVEYGLQTQIRKHNQVKTSMIAKMLDLREKDRRHENATILLQILLLKVYACPKGFR